MHSQVRDMELFMTNRPYDQPSSHVSQSEYWEELYRNGATGWDLGSPTPVFIGLKHLLPRTGSVLVLGCGMGHDAISFAQQGYRTVGVDLAATAVTRARQNARRMAAEVEFLQEDLFSLPPRFRAQFDIVLEYVTFCAIDPARRPKYGLFGKKFHLIQETRPTNSVKPRLGKEVLMIWKKH